jgi:5-hydroxyisourate hydrolase-like protein (transthyretin family)
LIWLSRYTLFVAFLITSDLASGSDLTGTVINGTTKKPAAGDEVVLVSLSEDGMKERARTTTDPAGHFSLAIAESQGTYLVRVVHQGVMYHKVPEPGAKSIVVRVFDVAKKAEGIAAVMDVQRFEATADTLEVRQLITMRNDSKPPRTLMNDRPFEISLPADAQVESGLVQVENGKPLKQRPVRGEQEGRYYFTSPIRPGDTRFAIVYRLPYRGEALIVPQIRNPLQRFVVMLPQSMKFEPLAAGIFRPMPGTSPDNVQGTAPASASQTVAFRISGKGTLQELEARRQQAEDDPSEQKPRPGGGLAPPIDAPDPLREYRWQVLGGLTVSLVSGAIYVMRKSRPTNVGSTSPVFSQALGRSINRRRPVEVGTRSRRHTHKRVCR